MQAEHLEDNLTSLDKFKEVSDPKLHLPDEMLANFLYSIITDCLKRHSQRTTSAKVYTLYLSVIYLYM